MKTCPLPKDGNPLNIDLWSHQRDGCLLCMLIVVYWFLVVFTNVIIVVRDEDCGWRRREVVWKRKHDKEDKGGNRKHWKRISLSVKINLLFTC